MKTTFKQSVIVYAIAFFAAPIIFTGCKKELALNDQRSNLLNDQNSTNAATATVSRQVIEVNIPFYVPCANDGKGEFVPVTGTVALLYTLTKNANSYTLKIVAEAKGTGVGEITGDEYIGRETIITIVQGSFINGQSRSSYVNSYKLIGKGGAVNSSVQQTINLVINANGTVTATVDYAKVVCAQIYGG